MEKTIVSEKQHNKLPYYPKLVLIRYALEKLDLGFPHGACQKTSRVIKVLTGLKEVAGLYTGPNLNTHGDLGDQFHSWNYDPKRKLYVDLTQDQFRVMMDPIYIESSENHPFLKTDEINTTSQKTIDFNESELIKSINYILRKQFVKTLETKTTQTYSLTTP